MPFLGEAYNDLVSFIAAAYIGVFSLGTMTLLSDVGAVIVTLFFLKYSFKNYGGDTWIFWILPYSTNLSATTGFF